jgi:hypothetical protein
LVQKTKENYFAIREKVDQDGIKIYYTSSSNDPNITHTKSYIWGWSDFNTLRALL